MNQNRKSSMCDADDGRGETKVATIKTNEKKKKKTSLQIQSKNKMSLIMRAARIAKGKFIG